MAIRAIVAVMGAIVLAALGVVSQAGGDLAAVTRAAGGRGVDVAHVFRGVFSVGVLCLVVSLLAMIRMEERPLRGRSEEVPRPAE